MIKRLAGVFFLLAAVSLIHTAYAQPASETTAVAVRQIDSDADAALDRLYAKVPDSRELVAQAAGVLVFPKIRAGGAILGAEYGRGVLRSPNSKNVYYNAITGSVGAQLGFESKAVILLFLTDNALDRFRSGNGWTAGVDGSVVLMKVGAGGKLDTNTARSAVTGFVLTDKGLMIDFSLTGTRFTKAPI